MIFRAKAEKSNRYLMSLHIHFFAIFFNNYLFASGLLYSADRLLTAVMQSIWIAS